jgi:hypothetical protein
MASGRRLDINQPVVVEVSRQHAELGVLVKCVNSGGARYVGKRSVSVVVIENISIERKAARVAIDWQAAVPAAGVRAELGRRLGIELQVIGDEQVGMAIVVVVGRADSLAPSRCAIVFTVTSMNRPCPSL